MGLAKRMLEEIWERGWESIGKSICPNCLENAALKNLAEENLDADECDYCGRTGEGVATDTDVVMTRIGESFHSEYRDPVHELPYDSGEGGYQGEWFDTYDLVYEELGEDIGHEEFIQDMILAFNGNGWCQRDYFTLRGDQALSFSWERFAEVVKHESRYLFLEHRDDDEYREQHEVEPADMLRRLGELVIEAGLIREFEPGATIYRARHHTLGIAYTRAAELGTAPREVSFANRMSPAGIPLFYGAFDADTAVREAWAGALHPVASWSLSGASRTAPLSP